jgi:hypothetical protein
LILADISTGARASLTRVSVDQFCPEVEFQRHDGQTFRAPALLDYFPGKRRNQETEPLPLPRPVGRLLEHWLVERGDVPGALWSRHLFHEGAPILARRPSLRREREARGYPIPSFAISLSTKGFSAKVTNLFGRRPDGSAYTTGSLRKLANSIASTAPFHQRYLGEPYWDSGLPVEVWCKLLLFHSLDYSITNLYRGILSDPGGVAWLRFITATYIWDVLMGNDSPTMSRPAETPDVLGSLPGRRATVTAAERSRALHAVEARQRPKLANLWAPDASPKRKPSILAKRFPAERAPAPPRSVRLNRLRRQGGQGTLFE